MELEVLEECKELWSLRESLEVSSAEASARTSNGLLNIAYQVEDEIGGGGGGGAISDVTTSFESNTEPLPMDDLVLLGPLTR